MAHSHCKHILKVCEPCDMAYCNKCNKEWGGACHRSHYYGGSQWFALPYYGTTTTVTGDGDSHTDTVYIGNGHAEHVGS